MHIGNQLVSILGSQLATAVPSEFSVEVDDGDVVIGHGPTSLRVHVGVIAGESKVTAESVTAASLAVISDAQDYISRVLGEPWPAPMSTMRLPLPFVGWQGDRLRLLYGDPDDPVLELPGFAAGECAVAPEGS